jgi:hypothetical protein|tara:strand:- start:2643 stop:3122 length:480 start_codon:yes stop_codon:yes gene_type:complete
MTTTDEWYRARFDREYYQAKEEVDRLRLLLKDVLWYNFEIECASWRRPWYTTLPDSRVELQSQRYRQFWNRGVLVEQGSFPVYYSGPVDAAAKVPPRIVINELKEARDYLLFCERQRTAVDDWAPGGPLYNELMQTTRVGKKDQYSVVYAPRKRKFSSA